MQEELTIQVEEPKKLTQPMQEELIFKVEEPKKLI
jgi:hypothetical protein